MNIPSKNYFTISDIIAKAISKEYQVSLRENKGSSLTIINEMTYINVWNEVLK